MKTLASEQRGADVLSATVRVAIADDHPVLLAGLREVLAAEPDFQIIAEFDSSKELLRWLEDGSNTAEVLVLDLALGETDGIELIKRIRRFCPSLRVVVFSMHEEGIYARRALRAGASGYVMKANAGDQLVRAVRTVLGGGVFLTGEARTRNPGWRGADVEGEIDCLTDRELAIFRLIGEGSNTRSMAASLGVSIKTVETHRENIKRKLGIDSLEKLISRASRWTAHHDAG